MSRFALSFFLFLAGCSTARFGALTPGVYECTSEVLLNTCEIPIASSSRLVELAGDEAYGLYAPSTHSGTNGFASPPWNPIQFGSQANPYGYRVSQSASCGESSSFRAELSSRVTRLAEDALEFEHELQFDDVARCGMPVDSCTVRYAIRCVPAEGI